MEIVASLDEVESVAKSVIEYVHKRAGDNAVILLYGDLAAGKTTLVSKIVQLLGGGVATSPTFSLQQCYGDKLFHYDFYRVDFDEIMALGLVDEFEKSGLHFVEWADDALKELLNDAGFNLFELYIEASSTKRRKYRLKAVNA
jgi:tRNA threonylcarbamoyladenosine biosynthesis protein TsaE